MSEELFQTEGDCRHRATNATCLDQTLPLSWMPLGQLEKLDGSEEHVARMYPLDVTVQFGWCVVTTEESGLVSRKHALKHNLWASGRQLTRKWHRGKIVFVL